MTLVGSASFSGSCIALRSGGNYAREEGGSFLIWYDLNVVVPWVFLFALPTPWFVAGNRSVPDCPFFHRPHVNAVRSFFDVKLRNVNIRSLSRRDSGNFQFLWVSLVTRLEFLILLINCLR